MTTYLKLIATGACLASVSALVVAGLPMKPLCLGSYSEMSVHVEVCYDGNCSGLPGRPHLYKGVCESWCCPESWQQGRQLDMTTCQLFPTADCCPRSGPKPIEGCPSPPEK